MIIDSNTHPTSDGKWFNTSLDATGYNLMKEMDLNRIDKAIIVPFEGIIENEHVYNLCQSNKDRFIPAGSINISKFGSSMEASDAFVVNLEKYNFPIYKFHNRLHRYKPDDERFMAVLETNNNLKSPRVIFICGLLFSDKIADMNVVPPVYFFSLAQRFSNTNFVIMHAGGSWALQLVEATSQMKNVFYDLSFVMNRYRISSLWSDLKYMITYYDQKTIFGSDYPEYGPSEALKAFHDLATDLSPEKRQNILGENMIKLLNFSYG